MSPRRGCTATTGSPIASQGRVDDRASPCIHRHDLVRIHVNTDAMMSIMCRAGYDYPTQLARVENTDLHHRYF